MQPPSGHAARRQATATRHRHKQPQHDVSLRPQPDAKQQDKKVAAYAKRSGDTQGSLSTFAAVGLRAATGAL